MLVQYTQTPIKLNRDEETEKEDWLSERAYVIGGMVCYTFTVTYMVFHSGAGESFNNLLVNLLILSLLHFSFFCIQIFMKILPVAMHCLKGTPTMRRDRS
jgi:hypothetical protein